MATATKARKPKEAEGETVNVFSKNKYRAKPTIYNGVRYASKSEAKRARELDDLKTAGVVAWWNPHPKYRLGCPENVYIADFLVAERVPGQPHYVAECHVEDVKGVRTAKFNRDVRLWKAYGELPLHIINGKKVEIVVPDELQ